MCDPYLYSLNGSMDAHHAPENRDSQQAISVALHMSGCLPHTPDRGHKRQHGPTVL